MCFSAALTKRQLPEGPEEATSLPDLMSKCGWNYSVSGARFLVLTMVYDAWPDIRFYKYLNYNH